MKLSILLGMMILTSIACSAESFTAKDEKGQTTFVDKGDSECQHYLPTIQQCVKVAYDPVTSKNFYFDLIFWDPKGASVQGPYSSVPAVIQVDQKTFKLGIDPFMKSMGHGTLNDTLIEVQQIAASKFFGAAENIYRVGPIEFIMPGPWQIRVIYGQSRSGSMPNSLEWKVYEQATFDIVVP